MNTEDEIHFQGHCIQLVYTARAIDQPWRAFEGTKHLASGATREGCIENAESILEFYERLE